MGWVVICEQIWKRVSQFLNVHVLQNLALFFNRDRLWFKQLPHLNLEDVYVSLKLLISLQNVKSVTIWLHITTANIWIHFLQCWCLFHNNRLVLAMMDNSDAPWIRSSRSWLNLLYIIFINYYLGRLRRLESVSTFRPTPWTLILIVKVEKFLFCDK